VSGLQPGQNILYWIVTNGPCSAVQDSVIITVEGLIIPSGFSPNGDNINDTFEIKGIGSFEIVSIKVLNRWGEEVFASDNYKNDWNGISKSGSELPNDTYYCVIESPILEKTHTGYIIINR
jgi:gliding motility-associated-like protein